MRRHLASYASQLFSIVSRSNDPRNRKTVYFREIVAREASVSLLTHDIIHDIVILLKKTFYCVQVMWISAILCLTDSTRWLLDKQSVLGNHAFRWFYSFCSEYSVNTFLRHWALRCLLRFNDSLYIIVIFFIDVFTRRRWKNIIEWKLTFRVCSIAEPLSLINFSSGRIRCLLSF